MTTHPKLPPPKQILMLGSRFTKGLPMGGAAALFELCLVKLQDCREFDVTVISTTRKSQNRFWKFVESIWIMLRIWSKIPFCDVVFLFVATSSLYPSLKWIAPCARLFGKRLIVKKFGGNPHDKEVADHQKQAVVDILHRIDLYLPETKYAHDHAVQDGIRSIWVPNIRELPEPALMETSKPADSDTLSLCYMGVVRPEKGIREIIAADPLLKENITIDVYGGFLGGLSEADFVGLKHVHYRGELPREKVMPTMQQYDAFVFPSYWAGEGHPGALIEAFSVGLPTITTNRNFINEVASSENALIVDAENVPQLVEAIHRFAGNPELRKTLSQKATERSKFFDEKTWMPLIIDCCRRLAKGEKIPDEYFDPDRMPQEAEKF